MTDTARLKLPLLAAGQAQKHVTHNEALLALDALVQMRLVETDRNAPPPDPGEGDAYGTGRNPTGAWAGKPDRVAAFSGGAWTYFEPRTGWVAWRMSDARPVVRSAAGWTALDAVIRRLEGLEAVAVGTSADPGNPLSVKAEAVLFAAKGTAEGGSGSVRVKVNRSGSGATASQLFQTDWSGRAEIGLMGDDAWRLKVSPDGRQWSDAIAASPGTGAVRIDALLCGRAFPGLGARIEAGFAGTMPGLALVDGTTSGNGNAVVFRRGAAVVGSIAVSATGTVYATTSDHRVKTEVAALKDAIDRVRLLRPCSFAWADGRGARGEGFIAHEAAAVVPDAVTGAKDAVDEQGEPVLQAVDLSRFVPLLTACVQELAAKVEALERGAV